MINCTVLPKPLTLAPYFRTINLFRKPNRLPMILLFAKIAIIISLIKCNRIYYSKKSFNLQDKMER